MRSRGKVQRGRAHGSSVHDRGDHCDFDTYDDLGPGASIAICDYNHGNSGVVGGAMLANEFIRLPHNYVDWLPPETPRWGRESKDAMRRTYRRTIGILGPVQEAPVFTAMTGVDPQGARRY